MNLLFMLNEYLFVESIFISLRMGDSKNRKYPTSFNNKANKTNGEEKEGRF